MLDFFYFFNKIKKTKTQKMKKNLFMMMIILISISHLKGQNDSTTYLVSWLCMNKTDSTMQLSPKNEVIKVEKNLERSQIRELIKKTEANTNIVYFISETRLNDSLEFVCEQQTIEVEYVLIDGHKISQNTMTIFSTIPSIPLQSIEDAIEEEERSKSFIITIIKAIQIE